VNNRQPKFNEEELLAFAKSYLSEAFPNPKRIDCPSFSDDTDGRPSQGGERAG